MKRHPHYSTIELYRDIISMSSEDFKERYLYVYSKREKSVDFQARKKITCTPTPAKTCLLEVKNSIYDRLPDVTRTGCPSLYVDVAAGENGGVDQRGSSMTHFIGAKVTLELLAMGRVGIFVDSPTLEGVTLADTQGVHPYVYAVRNEDIINWHYENNILQALVIRHFVPEIEDDLPIGFNTRYYKYTLLPTGGVKLDILEEDESRISTQFVDISKIPFQLLELDASLLTDAAMHQVTLLNLYSSDIHFIRDANFPLYLEQFDPASEAAANIPREAVDGDVEDEDTDQADIAVGPTRGRRYPRGMNAPSYIFPSSDPLRAGMAKEDKLFSEVREMMHLAVNNMRVDQRSAESRHLDSRSLESGLSAVGYLLELGERFILSMWNEYMNTSGGTIVYPREYSLKSDAERIIEGKGMRELATLNPSKTFQRECLKVMAATIFAQRVDADVLKQIQDELDQAEILLSTPEDLRLDVEAALATTDYISVLRGYPAGEAEKAQTQRAERAAQIVAAQVVEPDQTALRDASLSPDNAARERGPARAAAGSTAAGGE